jgi:hypothetical protein
MLHRDENENDRGLRDLVDEPKRLEGIIENQSFNGTY